MFDQRAAATEARQQHRVPQHRDDEGSAVAQRPSACIPSVQITALDTHLSRVQ